MSDILFLLSIGEPRYLVNFEVGLPNPKAYPPQRIDDYGRFYRGGDTSPHHSKCTCFACTRRTPSNFHCDLNGTVSEFAVLPPYDIRRDMCLCLCDRNSHACTCSCRITYTTRPGRFTQETPSGGLDATACAIPLTHRRAGLPTLVDGHILLLDDSPPELYRGVRFCAESSCFLATLDSRPLGAFRTAVEAALRIARETAVPHILALNPDALETILRFLPDATALYKSSRALRRALRPACYAGR